MQFIRLKKKSDFFFPLSETYKLQNGDLANTFVKLI